MGEVPFTQVLAVPVLVEIPMKGQKVPQKAWEERTGNSAAPPLFQKNWTAMEMQTGSIGEVFPQGKMPDALFLSVPAQA